MCGELCIDPEWELYCLEHGFTYTTDGLPMVVRVGAPPALPSVLVDDTEDVKALTAASRSCMGVDSEENDCPTRERRRLGAGYLRRDVRWRVKRSGGDSDVHRGWCLQDAVLRCCRGAARRRIRARLESCCRGVSGSGVSGTMAQACNFAAVGLALLEEGVFVSVVSEAEASRQVRKWHIGDSEGECLGVLLWQVDRQHVHRLVGGGLGVWVAGVEMGDVAEAPWWSSVVGAPKRGRGGGRGGFRGGDPRALGARGNVTQRVAASHADAAESDQVGQDGAANVLSRARAQAVPRVDAAEPMTDELDLFGQPQPSIGVCDGQSGAEVLCIDPSAELVGSGEPARRDAPVRCRIRNRLVESGSPNSDQDTPFGWCASPCS